jgi:uncharacterized membrane protein
MICSRGLRAWACKEACMKRFATAYAGTAAVMLLLDALWLGLIAQPLYAQQLGHLLADEPRFGVAALFYLLYALGVVIFAVAPQSGGAPWKATLGRAALFGFFAYATYDLTNLATLRDWPLALSLIDIAWGTAISTASAAGGKAALDWATRA